MSFVRLLGDVAGITSIKTHLKGGFGFRGTFDLAFLLIEEILQEVQKGHLGLMDCWWTLGRENITTEEILDKLDMF